MTGMILAISISFVDPEEVRPLGATEAAPVEATMCDDDKHGFVGPEVRGQEKSGRLSRPLDCALGGFARLVRVRVTRNADFGLPAHFVNDCDFEA
jgi:hypothetical protein